MLQLELAPNFREPEACQKPDGGFFCLLGETVLLLVWLVRNHLLSIAALRTYLGLIEVRGERFVRVLVLRNQAKEWNRTKEWPPPKPLKAHYAIVPELVTRTGLSPSKLESALTELKGLGLVATFPDRIVFATSLEGTSGFDKAAFSEWASRYQSHRRRQIPLGRRMLAYLATGADDSRNLGSLFAVVMGISLRGAYYYAHQDAPYRFAGWCRLDWLSELVGVSERSIQRLKERLKGQGWYLPDDNVSQWAENRYGQRFRISPEWGIPTGDAPIPPAAPASESPRPDEVRPDGPREAAEIPAQLSPPPGRISAPTVTPIKQQISPNGTKYQDNNKSRPRAAENSGPDSFQSEIGQEKNQDPSRYPAPRLSSLKPELDFVASGTARLMVLFGYAVKCGLIGSSEHDRLCWVACAVRAMSQANVERPAAVFLRLVKGKLFGHLSGDDWDEANRRLKLFDRGEPRRSAVVLPFPNLAAVGTPPRDPKPQKPKLSRDATIVLEVRQSLAKRGRERESVCALLVREAGWDRARYSVAVEECQRLGLWEDAR